MKRVLNRMIILLLSLWFGTFDSAAQIMKSWNFDSDPAGAIAKGFTNEFGTWQVTADPNASSKPNALAQTAKSANPDFNVTLASGTNYKDVDLTVRMRAVAGRNDQGGGLVWRAKDGKNYYIARYNPLEDNFRVYKVVDGKRSEFQSASIKHTDGWHTLRITMTGDHMECYYDGKKYLDVKDSTFTDAGRIGLWTKSDAQTHFDDLTANGK
jgi:Domain of Unknown Function (DUF1080)